MINFRLKKGTKKVNKEREVESYHYLKNFNEALLNLELNLQEERIRTPFQI